MKKILNIKGDIYILICSLFFSIFILVGRSYKLTSSSNAIFNNIWLSLLCLVIITFILFIILKIIKIVIKRYEKREFKTKFCKINKLFNKRPFFVSLIFILVAWLIYIIAFYPSIMTIDGYNQLKQFLKVENYYSDTVALISKDMLITNHHPVMHTLMLGGFLSLGRFFSNDNLGLFFYTIFQVLILSSVLAYTIKYLKHINVRNRFLYILLFMYAFIPAFPFYAITATKDTIYTALIILFIIEIHKIISLKKDEKIKIRKIIVLILLMLSICLMRNNGVYVVILSFLPIVFYSKKNIVRNLIAIVIVLAAYCTYLNVLLPCFNISQGSIRETLSIPFQQTARYKKYYENETTEEEKEKINKILNYETIDDMYMPESADLVKGTFKKNSTKEELLEYFKVWFEQLKKHPGVYVDSLINNTYGYFYPLTSSSYIEYHDLNNPLLKVQANFWLPKYQSKFMNYSYNNLSGLRKILANYAIDFQYIPVIGWSVNVAFNTWVIILLIAFSIAKQKKKDVILLLPSIVTLMVCIASPLNNCFRYALPIIFSNPFIALIILKEKQRNKINKQG